MAFIYTRSQFKQDINRGIQGRIGLLISAEDTMNEAVRETLNEVRVRSTKRRSQLVPNLLNGVFEYAVATDLHGIAISDVPAQAKREDGEFTLVPVEQFLRNPRRGDIAIGDQNGMRILYINSETTDESVAIDPMSLIGSGEWTAFGDAENLETNTDDYVKGTTSIEFDISAAAGTTAGIQKTIGPTDSIDLSAFISKAASAFSYARITSTTGITNYKLRLGTDSNNYYEFTVTVRNDGGAFSAGWNLLRFDLSNPTVQGSPDAEDIQWVALFMTKAISKVSEGGYMFNWLEARKGKYADVLYYSKYGWQTAAGAYLENSTDDTDLLVANTDEYDLFVKKGRVIAAIEAELPDSVVERRKQEYKIAMDGYKLVSPSEEKTVISSYHNYGED